jgi:hypothetical protein
MPGGRPTNASKEISNYLRGECQLIENCLNQLEEICKKPNIEQKEDMIGSIGLLVGKVMIRFQNIERELNLFDDD